MVAVEGERDLECAQPGRPDPQHDPAPGVAQPYLAVAPNGYAASQGDGAEGRLLVTVAAGHGLGAAEVAWSGYTLGTPQVGDSCGAQWTWDATSTRVLG